MRILRALRRFNTVAFTILSVLAIGLILVISTMLFRDWQRQEEYSSEFKAAGDDKNAVRGELIEAGDRKLSLYGRGELNGEFSTELKFVDARDGSITLLSDDPKQEFYNGTVIGIPRTEESNHGYGYLALAKIGELEGKPLFDAIFVRFIDMKQFKIATRILTLDGPQELDGKSFSAVIWDAQDMGRFLLFDSEAGKVVVTKDLNLQGQKFPNADSDSLDAAPRNEFP